MRISEFDYHLPEELIAQKPLPNRDASRMLVVDRKSKTWVDSHFSKFPNYLHTSDVVALNNTRVVPARLLGNRAGTGGRVEILLVRNIQGQLWECLVRPGNRLKAGSIVVFGNGRLSARILDQPGQELRHAEFQHTEPFERLLNELGSTPLPPYIKRNSFEDAADRERYQTIYSHSSGAIAAPTAGLHFSPEIMSRMREIASVSEITLHVGYGTFEPVRVDEVENHSVSAEKFEITDLAARLINEAKQNGRRIVAVGTTTVRALESSGAQSGSVASGEGWASVTIIPGYHFKIVDALLTNFHLPRSSLLLLVSAFAGRDLILAAYEHAVRQQYRFYSYGDCMLIL
ncbi:MAG: tRNA preQ1(34) S-adenosylmethionine ribosyltransferase-isomerase QueA [Pyrinomonadaceae bacterium]